MRGFENTLLQISKEGMGASGDELSIILIKNYLKLLIEDNRLPKIIVLYHEGVKLLSNKSLVLDELVLLEQKGVKLIACKTCINYYGLNESIAIGTKGTMIDIITLQTEASKIVAL